MPRQIVTLTRGLGRAGLAALATLALSVTVPAGAHAGGDGAPMSTAAHRGARDGLRALALLVTYPARLWLAPRTSPPPGPRPAAIHYFLDGGG
jgi:hypothetical protein